MSMNTEDWLMLLFGNNLFGNNNNNNGSTLAEGGTNPTKIDLISGGANQLALPKQVLDAYAPQLFSGLLGRLNGGRK